MICHGRPQSVVSHLLPSAHNILWLLLACFTAAAPISSLAAQVPEVIAASDTLQEIRLVDGSTLLGRVLQVRGDRISVETTAGVRRELTRDQIRSLRRVRGQVRHGEVWLEDPNAARLFIAPTGRSLRKAQGYFGVFELVFPFLSYGVTDWLTLAGGTPIFPAVIGAGFYFTPKVRLLAAPRAQLSAGVLTYFTTPEFDEGSTGIIYGVGTFGDNDNALTMGAGWLSLLYPEEAAVTDAPVLLMAAGELRVGRRGKLLTENHLWLGAGIALLSGGVRVFGERFSADLAVGVAIGVVEAICCLPLPLVNIVYNFAPRR